MTNQPAPFQQFPLALLGFGNVGRAFAALLLAKEASIREAGIEFPVVAVATGSHGMAVDPEGIPLQEALETAEQDGDFKTLSREKIDSVEDLLERCGAKAVIETTPVNYQDGQPAVRYLEKALELGMQAVTANKGPVVHGYRSLTSLAEQQGLNFYFESAVMDGAPVFAIGRCGLPGARVTAIRGVLNSTSNLILTRMENAESIEDAVAYAQSIGIAETDPSGDVDGWDAAVKVAALVTVLMDIPLSPEDIQRTGIRGLSSEDLQQAAAEGKRWKLVCEAELNPDQPGAFNAVVEPRMVDPGDPLYHTAGTSSVLQIESDVLGKLTLMEEDPSPATTAYGLLADLLNAFNLNF